MLVVLWHHSLSVQTTLYYRRAVLNTAIGYQGMHLPYWRGQLEAVEREVRRLIRGYEGKSTEVPRCVFRSRMVYYGEEMPKGGRKIWGAHGAGTKDNVRQQGGGGALGVPGGAARTTEETTKQRANNTKQGLTLGRRQKHRVRGENNKEPHQTTNQALIFGRR